jgi:quinol monooxygenase YgiN
MEPFNKKIMLIIAGLVFVDNSKIEKFVAEARKTIPLAYENEGCLFISFTLEDFNNGSMLVLERWEDRQSLDKHLSRVEVVDLFTEWGPKMRNEVRMYDAANERIPRA